MQYTINSMKLNNEQQEVAIVLRTALQNAGYNAPDSEIAWSSWIDITRGLALVVDAHTRNIDPGELKRRLQFIWDTIAEFWTIEQRRLLIEAIGDNGQEVLNKLMELEQPKRHKIIASIFNRIHETCGGVKAGLDVSDVDVRDILESI